ncbi:hypothetical protein GCM10010145_16010 [Streptomyces ruber]|uniref:Uncharacterized protein n=2 Tax=Streptomyces TaxID=1883 RepID=A0A918B9F9_9ACTN|nr:hypothetical protein GCM10010145_16010 [Streptomyces ruber]
MHASSPGACPLAPGGNGEAGRQLSGRLAGGRVPQWSLHRRRFRVRTPLDDPSTGEHDDLVHGPPVRPGRRIRRSLRGRRR